MAPNSGVLKAKEKADRLKREAEAIKKGKDSLNRDQRYQGGDEGDEDAEDEWEEDNPADPSQPRFHNYKPPLRLLACELISIILLTILLLFEPNGFSAISMKGTDTVGLLSSCSGGSCTSWLGAPAGASSDSGSTAVKRAPGDPTSSSSPTTFHLQTGLAAFCSFILILYAFTFHLIRLRTPPLREGRDPEIEERMKTSMLRRKITKATDFSGVKRFGYRVSRLFTGVNVVLLLCVCISAGVQATSGGFNTGFVLLVICWILLFLNALLEFMNDDRKIKGWLMVKKGFRPPCWPGKKNKVDDVESGKPKKREMEARR